ncbi:uncharacterized protein RBU33_011659 isoform 1-T1 [Hipposideros larvatus]
MASKGRWDMLLYHLYRSISPGGVDQEGKGRIFFIHITWHRRAGFQKRPPFPGTPDRHQFRAGYQRGPIAPHRLPASHGLNLSEFSLAFRTSCVKELFLHPGMPFCDDSRTCSLITYLQGSLKARLYLLFPAPRT